MPKPKVLSTTARTARPTLAHIRPDVNAPSPVGVTVLTTPIIVNTAVMWKMNACRMSVRFRKNMPTIGPLIATVAWSNPAASPAMPPVTGRRARFLRLSFGSDSVTQIEEDRRGENADEDAFVDAVANEGAERAADRRDGAEQDQSARVGALGARAMEVDDIDRERRYRGDHHRGLQPIRRRQRRDRDDGKAHAHDAACDGAERYPDKGRRGDQDLCARHVVRGNRARVTT